MIVNRVRELYSQRKPSLGTYVTLKAPAVIDVCAVAGLDHVRIDAYKFNIDASTLNTLIYAAHANGLTPWVRTKNNPWDIMQALDNGALVVSTKVHTAEEARMAVAAVRYPPRGTREAS